MKVLLILLGLLIILVLLRLFVVKEGFQDNIPLNPSTIKAYNNFIEFYTIFCTNWQKAIISSVASEIPQQPLTDPSQVQSSSAPKISTEQMNQYIVTLSQQEGQQFPQICKTLPSSIDSNSLAQVIPLIPSDPKPYINALNWMNDKLDKAHENLGSALQGGSIEGFDNMCQNIEQCLQNNPQLLQEVLQQSQQQNITQLEKQLLNKITPFISSSDLTQSLQTNQDLVAKSQKIQDQAQSGELVNQINVPGGNTRTVYNKPPGASTLSDMQQSNPEQYNNLKQNYSHLFSLKQMLEQINSNL
jgi:hypothetical protein